MRAAWADQPELEHVLALLTPANALAMRVALHTGLRIGDVLALRREDVKKQFWIKEAKTGKRRRVNLSGELVRELMACGSPRSPWCFPGRLDWRKHRTRQAVFKDLRRAAVACRVPQHISPHTARKVFASEVLARRGDEEAVRRALGHSDAATTMIYLMAETLYHSQYERAADGRVHRRRNVKAKAEGRRPGRGQSRRPEAGGQDKGEG